MCRLWRTNQPVPYCSATRAARRESAALWAVRRESAALWAGERNLSATTPPQTEGTPGRSRMGRSRMGRSRCSPFRTATAHTRERELRASPYPQLGTPQVVVSAHPPSPGGAHAAYRLARSWPAARLSGGGALADRRAEEDTRCTARVGRLRGRVATALRGAARRTATPPYVALRRAAFRRRAGDWGSRCECKRGAMQPWFGSGSGSGG